MARGGIKLSFDGLTADFEWISLNKKKEKICGDYYEIIDTEKGQILVLSDGLGSGVKANILATLTVKMLGKMIANHIPIPEAVATVTETLPECSVRQLAYATFTIVEMEGNTVHLVQFDNPDAILIRNDAIFDYPIETYELGDKEIHDSTIILQENDMLILMSDGVTNAGMGKTVYGGLQRKGVLEQCEKLYHPGASASEMVSYIAEMALNFNLFETDDDITVMAIRMRKEQVVNLMIGPPKHMVDDEIYMKHFFENEGLHVVCGGSTAQMVANYLNTDCKIIEGSGTDDIPSRMHIEGVDLATEGIITLEALLEKCEQYEENHLEYIKILKRTDPTSKLANILFEKATEINIFFGNAHNVAQENLHIAKQGKEETVNRLIAYLKGAGKKVNIAFWTP